MSVPGRVESKHLFNHLPLNGEYDEEVTAEIARLMENMGNSLTLAGEVIQIEDSGESVAGFLRPLMDQTLTPMASQPYWMEQMSECIQDSVTVPPTDTNTASVTMLIHRPKRLQGASPAIVYVHGGGVVAGTAIQSAPHASNLAQACGVIVFNVDYRLAPEAKCPENVKDFYSCLKYVLANSSSLGVDPARVAIMGESGGGYLTAALSVMLAEKEESNLVKLSIPVIPMVDDYCWGDTNSMTKEEASQALMQRKIWNALATDLTAQRNSPDPLLFPAKAKEETLTKFPPTVIFTVEFDFYITETLRFARRLRAAGRLLDLVVVPGIGHGQAMEPKFKKFYELLDIMKTIVREYLVN